MAWLAQSLGQCVHPSETHQTAARHTGEDVKNERKTNRGARRAQNGHVLGYGPGRPDAGLAQTPPLAPLTPPMLGPLEQARL